MPLSASGRRERRTRSRGGQKGIPGLSRTGRRMSCGCRATSHRTGPRPPVRAHVWRSVGRRCRMGSKPPDPRTRSGWRIRGELLVPRDFWTRTGTRDEAAASGLLSNSSRGRSKAVGCKRKAARMLYNALKVYACDVFQSANASFNSLSMIELNPFGLSRNTLAAHRQGISTVLSASDPEYEGGSPVPRMRVIQHPALLRLPPMRSLTLQDLHNLLPSLRVHPIVFSVDERDRTGQRLRSYSVYHRVSGVRSGRENVRQRVFSRPSLAADLSSMIQRQLMESGRQIRGEQTW